METLDPWGVLLNSVGETLNDAGRLLKDGQSDLSIDDLQNIKDSLQLMGNVLERRINFLKAG